MPLLRTPRSIRQSLLRWLLLPQLLLWVVGGLVGWRIAIDFAGSRLDQTSQTQVRALSHAVEPALTAPAALDVLEGPAHFMMELEAADQPGWQITALHESYRIGSMPIPAPPPAMLKTMQPGQIALYSTTINGQQQRVAMLDVNYSSTSTPKMARIQIAKNPANYQKRALQMVRDMLLPLATLAFLISILMYLAVNRGLLPLRRLVEEIDGIQSGDLHPVVIARAPSEVKAITNALNHLLSSVQNNVDNEKRFINDAAHQLRTPLAGLISQAELALGESDPDKLRERIRKMHGAAQRSSHLVQQMLALARTEGASDRKATAYDLAELAREVARESINRALTARIDLGYEGADQAMIKGDRLMMREAIGNLIDNALQYAGSGAEVTVRVHQQGSGDAARVILEVVDNGPGVLPEHLPRLFQRFWRANDHLPGGCGIGLALVAKVASQHRATLEAEQARPHGLIIRLTLPEANAHPQQAPAPPQRLADWDYT